MCARQKKTKTKKHVKLKKKKLNRFALKINT